MERRKERGGIEEEGKGRRREERGGREEKGKGGGVGKGVRVGEEGE